MNEIDKVIKIVRSDGKEGYVFSYTNEKNVTCEIVLDAEIDGHGCLYNIYLPQRLAINGICFGGNINKYPTPKDFCIVLNKIFDVYNMDFQIIQKTSKIGEENGR